MSFFTNVCVKFSGDLVKASIIVKLCLGCWCSFDTMSSAHLLHSGVKDCVRHLFSLESSSKFVALQSFMLNETVIPEKQLFLFSPYFCSVWI